MANVTRSDDADHLTTETRDGENTGDGSKFEDYKIECTEINKRSIGKAIIQFCGNEGMENDRNKEILRKLLQAIISHVEKERSDTWQNAEIRIYDENFEIYSIKAGLGKNMFMVSLDENDEPKVIKTKQSRVISKATERQKCILF